MPELFLTAPARRDLQDIFDTIAADRPLVAGTVTARILRTIAILASHPEAGSSRPGLGRGARLLAEHPYVVLYRVEGDLVRVIRIVHGARRITRRLLRED